MSGRTKQDAKTKEHQRLAAALRENLKRRKAQARARATPKRLETAGDDGGAPHDSAGFDKEE